MSTALEQTGSHQWGSYPAPSIEQGVREIGTVVGQYLVFGMPDCELNTPTRQRDDWIIGNHKKLRKVPGITVIREGDYSSYEEIPQYAIKGLRGIKPEDLELGYHEMAKETLPIIKEVLGELSLEHLRIQVGIPGYRQLPAFAFGKYKPLLWPGRYQKPVTRATQDEIFRLTTDPQLREQGLGIQFEHPLETLAVLEMARKGQRIGNTATWFMAGGIAAAAEDLPPTVDAALHFCLGRFLGRPADAPDPETPGAFEPVVNLINATLSSWPDGHKPPKVVGMPIVPEGGQPLSKQALRELKAQLEDLDLPRSTTFAPGIATQNTSASEIATMGEVVQDAVGAPVAISSPCGKSSLRVVPGLARQVLEQEAQAIRMLRGVA